MREIRRGTGNSHPLFLALLAVSLLSAVPPARAGVATGADALPDSGQELYRTACMACHGADGAGSGRDRVGFDLPLPNFTDCNFATREGNTDWIAVAAEGGPARGFSEVMPAFGDILTDAQIEKILNYVRGFCRDPSWPRGELNLPRPLFTGKAFPEDEAAFTSRIATRGDADVATQLIYERRIGARGQIEITVPFEWIEQPVSDGSGDTRWQGGLGDVSFSAKRVLFASLKCGSILSVGGEIALPTGNEEKGLGNGTPVFEPYVAFGQILPSDFFLQFQGGGGISFDTEKTQHEVFWRVATGRMFYAGHFGRIWTPMVELLGSRELVSGADTDWDVVPQVQVTLSARHHVRFNLGARVPLNNTDVRNTEIALYLLWDWFDGGFFEGW